MTSAISKPKSASIAPSCVGPCAHEACCTSSRRRGLAECSVPRPAPPSMAGTRLNVHPAIADLRHYIAVLGRVTANSHFIGDGLLKHEEGFREWTKSHAPEHVKVLLRWVGDPTHGA